MSAGGFADLDGVNALLATTPIHRFLGFAVTAMDAASGTLVMTCPVRGNPERYEGAEHAHGGAIATLIDSAATFACSVHLQRGVPTMSITVDYLRPAYGEMLEARATVRRAGKTAGIIDVEVHAGGKIVALGRCTQATAS